MSDRDKPVGFWVADSSGHNTYHINGTNLSFKESLAGSLSYNRDAEFDKQWLALDRDGNELGCGSLYKARSLVQESAFKPAKTNKQVVTYSPAPRKR